MSASALMLRNLIRELRHTNHSHKKLTDSPVYQYVARNFRKNQVTAEQTCKAHVEGMHLADTYLCYLRSSRKSNELRSEYHGRSERTVREAADMVGFKLPHDTK